MACNKLNNDSDFTLPYTPLNVNYRLKIITITITILFL